MIFHDIKQSDESGWLELRAGKVTGSAVAKIMANYGKSFGEPAKRLAVEIALYRITGRLERNNYSNEHMQRGHEQEPIARALYETEMFYTVDQGGFFDNGFTGCSPDGLVSDTGLIEIKSVISAVHFATVKRNDVDPAYRWQLAFYLHETGREWIDFVSYCAGYPIDKQLFIKRKTRHDFEAETEQLLIRLDEFSELVDETQLLLRDKQL